MYSETVSQEASVNAEVTSTQEQDAHLISICRDAEADIAAIDIDAPFSDELYADMDRRGRMINLISEMPAVTLAGLKAKASVFVLVSAADAALALAHELVKFSI